MANPQKENGYVAIANEIWDKLVQTDLLASELRIVLFVLRKTYGWNKKEDVISLSQFQKSTNLSRNTVVKSIKTLLHRGILVKRCELGNQKIAYKFNKNWEEWALVHKGELVQHPMKTSAIERMKLVKRYAHTTTNTKTNTKDKDKIKSLNRLKRELIEKKVL